MKKYRGKIILFLLLSISIIPTLCYGAEGEDWFGDFFIDDALVARPYLHDEPRYTQGLSNEIEWDAVTDATGYFAEVSENPNFAPLTDESGWVTGLTHEFGPLSDDQAYFYRVKARDTLYTGPWSRIVYSIQDANEPNSAVLPLPYVSPPVFLGDAFFEDQTSGVEFYEIYYSKDGGAWEMYPQTFGSDTFVFDSNITGGDGFYEFYSIAQDYAGNRETEPLEPDAFTIISSIPTSTPAPSPTGPPTATPEPTGPTAIPTVTPTATEVPSGDTCEDTRPIEMNGPIAYGDTCAYEDDYDPYMCQPYSFAPDVVFEFTTDQCYSNVRICLNSDFDAVMYLRSQCPGMAYHEMACSDELTAPCVINDPECQNFFGEVIELSMLEAGEYYIFVDGYADECGSFCLELSGRAGCQAPDQCPGDVISALPSANLMGNTCFTRNLYTGSCNLDTDSPDSVYQFSIERCYHDVSICLSSDFPSALYLRHDECASASAEVACTNEQMDCNANCPDYAFHRGLTFDTLFPGDYYIFIDGDGNPDYCGAYCLEANGIPTYIEGDDCEHIYEISLGEQVVIPDMICLMDDFSPQFCGYQPGGIDKVFKLEVPCMKDVHISVVPDAWDVVLYLRSDCSDPGTEIYCVNEEGAGIEEMLNLTLEAGEYYIFVDGNGPDQSGGFSLSTTQVNTHHCVSPIEINCGVSLEDQTNEGYCNEFVYYGCGAPQPYNGPDVVYRVDTVPDGYIFQASLIPEEGDDEITFFVLNDCNPQDCIVGGENTVEFQGTGDPVYIVCDGLAADDYGPFVLNVACNTPTPTPTSTMTATSTATPTNTWTPTITPTPTPQPIPASSQAARLALIGLLTFILLTFWSKRKEA